MKYSARVVDSEVEQALSVSGAVLLEGPRGCGKTSTALQFALSSVRLDTDQTSRELAQLLPHRVLEGATPRLIDEWQIEPELWNHVRAAVDNRQAVGQFILAGSARMADSPTRHVGAGRIHRITMRPMTLWESGYSSGETSLASLLEGTPNLEGERDAAIETVTREICRGGLPAFQGREVTGVISALGSYLRDVERGDFSIPAGSKQNPARIRKILRSLARNIGSEISLSKLASEISHTESETLKPETLETYLQTLRDLMLIEDVPPWSPHLRSSYAVRKAAKRYFVDPAFAVAALGASPATLLQDLSTLGFLFENLVMRDLQVFAQHLGWGVSHYRDSSGLEVDAIVSAPSGTWAGIEIKLNPRSVDQAAGNLLKFRARLDESNQQNLGALAVITSGAFSYRRDDGVIVISLAHLGP